MTRLQRASIAGFGNGALLLGLGSLFGQIQWWALGLAAVHAAVEASIQRTSDQRSASDPDGWLFHLSGLSLFAMYGLAVVGESSTYLWALVGLWTLGIGLRALAMLALGSAFRSATVPASHRVQRGPYRWMDHPSEVGLMLCVCAAFGFCSSPVGLSVVAVCFGLSILRIALEEARQPAGWAS